MDYYLINNLLLYIYNYYNCTYYNDIISMLVAFYIFNFHMG